MADVHRLRNIGSAVVDEHPPRARHRRGAAQRICGNLADASGQDGFADPEIQEPRPRDGRRIGKVRGRPLPGNLGRDVPRHAPHRLGRGHGAIALKVGKVRTIRPHDRRVLRIQLQFGEYG